MFNETILYLPWAESDNFILRKYGRELLVEVGWDPDLRLGDPLKKVFSGVISYDVGKDYAEIGVRLTNKKIIEMVRQEHPKYVFWPTRMYEIQETTFHTVRYEGAYVIGWFFDDECRFEGYSRWWIPYMDYILTTDKQSVERYQELGATAMHLLVTSDSAFFRRLEIAKSYDVSFVGSRIADRGELVDTLLNNGIDVHTFGKGWVNSYITNEQMVNIYNATKINLCFTKSYGTNTRPQLKNKIFDSCMCGGFLLCEYIPGIEEFFEVNKEIVCFNNSDELLHKIQYYLAHNTEREAIAEAGWKRAQRDHSQVNWLTKVFEAIEIDSQSRKRNAIDLRKTIEMSSYSRHLAASYHLGWAKVLKSEGFEQHRWQDELELAHSYEPGNMKAYQICAT